MTDEKQASDSRPDIGTLFVQLTDALDEKFQAIFDLELRVEALEQAVAALERQRRT